MRECIYCGRQLEKGEVCTCAMSAAKRREREAAEKTEPKKEDKRAERESRAQEKARQKENKRREKERAREAKRNARASSAPGSGIAGVFRNVWELIKSFILSPVETVMNPGRMGKAEIFILAAIEGIICGLCAFSIITGAARGPLSFLGNVLGFRGMAGYSILLGWLMSAVSGAIGGLVVFFIYSGIFYLVNRFIFRGFIGYWDFIRRFVFVAMPIAAVGLIGIVLGMFSQQMFFLMLIAGMAGSVVLTYELLRSVWHTKSPAVVMYTMMLCIFVFMMIISGIMQLSI